MRDRYLNLIPGALYALILSIITEYYTGNRDGWLYIVIASISLAPVLAGGYIIRKFKPDFKERWGWCVAGAILGTLVFMPLIVTPQCGFWDDKCKPVRQQVRHAQ